MVNTARKQRVRHGVLRPGPVERVGAARLEEEERTATMEAARARKASQRASERQRVHERQRVRERQREEEAQLLVSERLQNGVEDHMSVRDLNRVSL
jgi:hypothetical protein